MFVMFDCHNAQLLFDASSNSLQQKPAGHVTVLKEQLTLLFVDSWTTIYR